jgi:peptidyl-tRNA hydrolase, PTH1 family
VHLVVGLGNPGEEYVHTPHNAGFLVVDRLAERENIRVSRRDSKAHTGVGEIAGRSVMLAKPQTFMNLSGVSVKALLAKHEIAVGNLIVIWDELNLSWGGLKILAKGSAGGHNGAESVIRSVGTQEFTRVRLGVNPGHPIRDGAEYLLAPMKRTQWKELEPAIDLAAEAVGSIIAEGVEKSMTKYNRRARGSTDEEE